MIRALPLLALLVCVGCDRGGPPDPQPAIERLHDVSFARADRDHERLAALVIPSRRTALIETLEAVDAFVDAAGTFEDDLRRRFGAGLADGVQLKTLGENLGVLSPGAEILDARIVPDRSDVIEVSYIVRETPPARYARMVEMGGQWFFDPGAGFSPALPRAFEAMAAALQQFTDEMNQDPQLAQRALDEPEWFTQQLVERLAPGLAMLPQDAAED